MSKAIFGAETASAPSRKGVFRLRSKAEAQAKALGDSERRCRDGLRHFQRTSKRHARRMDAMLADTKELTRELAKHKYLSQAM